MDRIEPSERMDRIDRRERLLRIERGRTVRSAIDMPSVYHNADRAGKYRRNAAVCRCGAALVGGSGHAEARPVANDRPGFENIRR
ncbi:hypothetical protein [Nocardia xishanensis]|uniref:Uncharacterized protein n=1 Tax=Nocardia xishanensis TaxID=238964 RepID=A0ABW7WV54_9NOCA